MNKLTLEEELLTMKQVQDYLKCSHAFILKKRSEGVFESVKLSAKKVLYKRSSIDSYLNANTNANR